VTPRIAREGRHRHEPAHLDSERTHVVQERGERSGRDPRLRLLAGEVDLDERGNGQALCRRLAVERVAELAEVGHVARLARLKMADEVPAEARAVPLVLGREVLQAVLSHDLDAGLREHAHLVRRDVLRRRDDGHVRPDLLADAGVVRGDPRAVSGERQRSPGGR
jgi:hypothetical protein